MRSPASRFAMRASSRWRWHCALLAVSLIVAAPSGAYAADAAPPVALLAGAAKVDITDRQAGPVHDPLYVRALVLKRQTTTVVIVAVDAVAIGEIGHISNDYLPNLRRRLQGELGIPPRCVLVNASHCHGVVCADIQERTFQAVRRAAEKLVPVTVGAGSGSEDRVSENRRLKLRSGKEVDVRRAYALPPDEAVAAVGPIDPEIGVLRLNTLDGRTLAVVYNFACHPIQGVPGGGNTADLTGCACRVLEENLGDGAIALFLQGCAGDINPIGYKNFDRPPDAQPLGNLLGLSTLRAARQIATQTDNRLEIIQETLKLPRADLAQPIEQLVAERDRLVESLQGTRLNLKSFLQLSLKYNLSADFPSAHAYRYLHEKARGRAGLTALDAENRRELARYLRNVHTMEQLTRLNTNLALLRKHHAANYAAGVSTVDAEVLGLRVGEFVLVTFPGEPSVQVGLNIKDRSPHPRTFVAGYTNGYLYYAPTAEQLKNVGGAQEDSDCLLAPQWQQQYEDKAAEILERL